MILKLLGGIFDDLSFDHNLEYFLLLCDYLEKRNSTEL